MNKVGTPWPIWLVQTWQVSEWARLQKWFGSIYKEHVLQLLTRATGNQPDLLLALACPVQSVLSPSQQFWTGPLGPNPLGLCAGGNKLSSPLSNQSRLISLVAAATLISLRSGFGSHFGPGRVVRETSLSSLAGPDCCHLVWPVLWAWSCLFSGLLSPKRCLQSLGQCHWSLHPRNHKLFFHKRFISHFSRH